MKPQLWHFHGGLKLDGHKSMSMHEPVVEAGIPPRLVLPLQQHIGSPAEPIVKVGDTVLKNQMIAQASDYVSVPIHAPSSGKIVAIEEHEVPHPSGMSAMCIIIETDGHDSAIERDTSPVDYLNLEPSALRNIIRETGIVGLGGAGFPSFIKLNPGPDTKVETLILNGAECEPYLTSDARLMLEQPKEIIEGIRILTKVLGCKKSYVGIEKNKQEAIRLFQKLSAEIKNGFTVIPLNVKYPQGAEKQLIKAITNRDVPAGGLPMDVGVVVQNVATVLAIRDAFYYKRPLMERVVTVSGNLVKNPGNIVLPIGTPISYVMEKFEIDSQLVRVMISGGPMMGRTSYSFESPITKTTSALLFFDGSRF